METLIYTIGGILLAIIAYFLKRTIDDVDKMEAKIEMLKDMNGKMETKIELMENNHSHLNAKVDTIISDLKSLIIEIKHLSKEVISGNKGN